MRARLVAIFTAVIAVVARADAPAGDAQSPQSIIASHNLLQSDQSLVLPEEQAVHEGVAKVKQLAQTVHVETTSRRDLRFDIQQDRHDLVSLLNDLVSSDTQLLRYIGAAQHTRTDDSQYQQIIDLYNATSQRCNSLLDQINAKQKALDDAFARLGQVPDSRAEYDNAVMDVATQGESVAKTYSALSKDPAVVQAIASENASSATLVKLGPTSAFAADLELLRKDVKDVVDSPVPVRFDRDAGDLYVQAVINGNVHAEMCWDSGASLVLLNADTAKQLGLRLTDQDPQVEMEMAGGVSMKVHVTMLDSIRLGGFTVRHLPCMVLPDNSKGHPDNLLGDAFQSHFISRMDQRTQQLQLTPADPSVLVGAIPHDLLGAK